MIITPPAVLTKNHIVENFDCGHPLLNSWLKRFAWQNQQANAARTYVACLEDRVVGFYSLAVGSVEHAEAPIRIKKGLAGHPIPVMILARLGVDINYQGMKIGKGLLKDAILRTIQASQYAGIRAILVHAKDELVQKFYKGFGFESSPVDPLQSMLLIKDAVKTIEKMGLSG